MTQENERIITGEETQPEQTMLAEETAIIGGDFVKNGAEMQETFGTNSSFDINLYKGKLFFTQHLFTAEGIHLPANFALAYNARFADTDYVHGQTTMLKGWKLNYQQFIRFADNKCVYVDGAFKEHIFEKSTNNANVYLDTSARSGSILRPVSGGYEIFDGANTTLLFQSNRLVKITQTKGATPVETTIAYNSLGKVNQITDGLGKIYTVSYADDAITISDSNNVILATITADSNNRLATVKYYEDDDHTTSKKCLFGYDSSTHCLTSVEDQLALEKVSFAYSTNSKLTSLKKYASKGGTDTPLQSVFFTYNTGNTIVSKNNGTDTNNSQIRYKYTFDANGEVKNSCEIDANDEPIGKQTFITYTNGAETHITREDEQIVPLLNDSIPTGVGPGVLTQDPIEVCNNTISFQNDCNQNTDVTFSWHLEYEDASLPYPDSVILVEFLVNNALVFSREYPVAETISLTDNCTVSGINTTEDARIVMKVTPPYSEQQVLISDVQASYIPYSKTEKRMYIKYTPSYDIIFATDDYITETVNGENQYWFPAKNVTFSTSAGTITPNVFSYDDYQKTMLSYFRNPNKFNFYYNEGTKVVYETTFLNACYESQAFSINQLDLAFVATTKHHQTFEQVEIEDDLFKIYHRRANYAYASNYVKLDSFLRLKIEYQIGSAAKSYAYDDFGNVLRTYIGGVIETTAFSADGQKITAVPNHITEDSQTEYTYDNTGILSSMQLPNGQDVSFAYQNRNILNRVSANVGGVINENIITYEGAFIATLTHNNTTFVYEYDDRNKVSKVFVKPSANSVVSETDIPLIDKTTTYSTDGSYNTRLAYANGYTVKQYYDKYDRLVRISSVTASNESPLATFIYADASVSSNTTEPNYTATSNSLLRKSIDSCANIVYNYTYNNDRICTQVDSSAFTTDFTYDAQGRVCQKQVDVGATTVTTVRYFENDFSSVISSEAVVIGGQTATTRYTRNGADLPTEITRTVGDEFEIEQNYTYKPWSETNPQTHVLPLVTNESTQLVLNGVSQETQNKGVEYDANGNIIQYGTTTYEYDSLNRLIRENNQELGKTFLWTYDAGGNITSRNKYNYTTVATSNLGTYISQDEYRYNASWKDRLSYFYNEMEGCDCNSQNGNIRAITPGLICLCKRFSYDNSGNPTIYRGNALEWNCGRLLTKAILKDGTVNISYDAQGRRRSKTKGSVYYNYTYEKDKLLQLNTNFGGDPATLTFIYDSLGVKGFAYNNRVYHYVKNLFGDVTDIYCGSTHIVHYTYDAFGNGTVSHTLSNLSQIGNDLIGYANPFRYRSYLFDKDIGFYYVQGRYYDPQTGRFISPAKVSDLNPKAINGLNLYSFAGGNHISASYMYSVDGSSRSDIVQVNSIIGSYIANQQFGNTSNSEHVLAWVVKGVDIALTSKSLLFSASTIHNNISYFKNNLKPFDADMKTLGTSMKNGVLAFNQFSWSMGSLDAIGLAISVGLDIYDSVQRGVSTGGVILGATLTAAKGIGLIYLNKGIINGATALGGIFGPGGAVVGFIVGVVASIVVDIFLDNWLDELIDNLAT